ncbi:MAG: hypothetical protein KA296_13755 [Marinobacter sp.]|nr:hypothetical protein [Marinobacter sp.]
MSQLFAMKGSLPFEPRALIDLGTVAVAYTTPSAYQLKLGNLANMNGTEYQVRYKLARTGGAASVAVTLSLKRGNGTVLWSKALNLAAGATAIGAEDLDLGTVSGGVPLFLEAEVTTADAGTTADLDVDLIAETPAIVGGC